MEPAVLARLVRLARSFSGFDSLEELVREIIQTAAALTRAQAVSLLLFDEADQMLRYADAPWCSDPERLAALENLAIQPGTGVAGWVYRSHQPILAVKTGRDSLVPPVIELLLGARAVSAAAVPVEFRSKPIGVLECLNAPNGRFDQNDLEILQTLASLLATAVYNEYLGQQANRSAQAATKLEQMKSDFIAIASHELRTPLGVIIGHTALLQEIADEEMQEPLEIVSRNAAQLNEIIENLTVINQIENEPIALGLQVVSLNETIQHCIEKNRAAAQAEKIRLWAQVPDKDLIIRADPKWLYVALNNLVGNALQFTAGKTGGMVGVQLDKKDRWGIITIWDNGIGIPTQDLEKIFDRFTQIEHPLRRKHGGMGVGLSIAKHMVEALGGSIRVYSAPGKGSAFVVTLPLA